MNKSVYFIVASFICFFTSAESLQCYACIDCPTVTSGQLITCSAQPTTTTVMTTESTTTTPSNTTNTSEPTTILLTTTVTPMNVTENTTSTTLPTTINEAINSTSKTASTTSINPISATNKSVFRGKRSVLQGKQSYTPSIVDMNRATNTFYCFKATIRDQNNTDVVIRGCGQTSNGSHLSICQELNGTHIQQCETCTTDKCNNAPNMKSSVIFLLSLLSLVTLKVI